MNYLLNRVLIVEDDLIFTKSLEHQFKDVAKEVFIANSSENGTYYLNKEKPDLIFLDNLLPGINGIEVIKLYKEKCPEAVVVLMSKAFTVTDILKALESGVNYILKKDSAFDDALVPILDYFKAKEEPSFNQKIVSYLKWFNKEDKDVIKNIAIIEDEAIFALSLESLLKQISLGQQVQIHMFDSKESYLLCKDSSIFDLVFLDYYLPDANGKEMMDLIKSNSPDAKFILLTIQKNPNVIIDLNLKGLKHYIIKDKNWKSNCLNILNRMGLFGVN